MYLKLSESLQRGFLENNQNIFWGVRYVWVVAVVWSMMWIYKKAFSTPRPLTKSMIARQCHLYVCVTSAATDNMCQGHQTKER